MQSSGTSSSLCLHFPLGRVRFERPKSVRSKITTLLSWRSCICMAEMPTDSCRRVHSPPPGKAGMEEYWREPECESEFGK